MCIRDRGYTYTPVASSVLAGLKASDGSYYKRVQVGIKLMEMCIRDSLRTVPLLFLFVA